MDIDERTIFVLRSYTRRDTTFVFYRPRPLPDSTLEKLIEGGYLQAKVEYGRLHVRATPKGFRLIQEINELKRSFEEL